MKTAFPLLFMAFGLLSMTTAADETTSKRFDIETLTGDIYKDSRIIKVTPADLTIMHDTGVAKISFDNLPAALKEKFGYETTKAEAYLAKQEEMKKEAEAKARAASEKRNREDRQFIAKIEAQEKKQAAADAALFPPTLAPLPGENAPTPPTTLGTTARNETNDDYGLVPKTTPLGPTHDPGFRTGSRSYRWSYGDGIMTYDGYYPSYGYGYGWYSPPPVYYRPPHHHHGHGYGHGHHHHHRSSGGFTGRSVIRITR